MFWALWPLFITFLTVITGNHFLLDAVLGLAVAGVSLVARAAPRAAAAARLDLRQGVARPGAAQPQHAPVPPREHAPGHRAPAAARAPP